MSTEHILPANYGPCVKQQVTCTLVTTEGEHIVGGNWCANPQTVCPRADMPSGQGYELCRNVCQQIGHAEEVALKLAGEKAKGAKAYLEGHTYACMNCQQQLFGAAGVASLSIGAPPSVVDISSTPASVHPPLDAIYESLKQSGSLLREGRKWGIRFGLTSFAKKILIARHGTEAKNLLANCPTINDANAE